MEIDVYFTHLLINHVDIYKHYIIKYYHFIFLYSYIGYIMYIYIL